MSEFNNNLKFNQVPYIIGKTSGSTSGTITTISLAAAIGDMHDLINSTSAYVELYDPATGNWEKVQTTGAHADSVSTINTASTGLTNTYPAGSYVFMAEAGNISASTAKYIEIIKPSTEDQAYPKSMLFPKGNHDLQFYYDDDGTDDEGCSLQIFSRSRQISLFVYIDDSSGSSVEINGVVQSDVKNAKQLIDKLVKIL